MFVTRLETSEEIPAGDPTRFFEVVLARISGEVTAAVSL